MPSRHDPARGLAVNRQVGPVHLVQSDHIHPLRGHPRGRSGEQEVEVAGQPVVKIASWHSGGDESRLCKVLDCDKPVPTPPPTGDPDPAGR